VVVFCGALLLPAGRGGEEEMGSGAWRVWCAAPGRPRWREGEFAAVRALYFLGVLVP
jgi:hypothetical protein